MGCDAWIIRRLIPLQDCLVTTPTAKKLLRVMYTPHSFFILVSRR